MERRKSTTENWRFSKATWRAVSWVMGSFSSGPKSGTSAMILAISLMEPERAAAMKLAITAGSLGLFFLDRFPGRILFVIVSLLESLGPWPPCLSSPSKPVFAFRSGFLLLELEDGNEDIDDDDDDNDDNGEVKDEEDAGVEEEEEEDVEESMG